MLKKIAFLLLVLSIGLSTFAKPNFTYTMPSNSGQTTGNYINTIIKTPITGIGDNKPPEQISTQTKQEVKTITKPVTTTTKKATKTSLSAKSILPSSYYVEQEDESGLEVSWNKWHANVRNTGARVISWRIYPIQMYSMPLDGILNFIYKVDSNKNITDVVLLSHPTPTIKIEQKGIYYSANMDFYMYIHKTDKFYKLQLPENSAVNVYNHKALREMLDTATITPIEAKQVPYYLLYKPFAERVQDFSSNKSLTFPKKTKRTFMIVETGITSIDSIKTGGLLSKFFNDIERQ